MGERRLISIRRLVPADELEAYERGWKSVRDLAIERGARAWRFQASSEPLSCIEFLEFGDGPDPRHQSDVAAALRDLDAIARGNIEEWKDAT